MKAQPRQVQTHLELAHRAIDGEYPRSILTDRNALDLNPFGY